MQTKNQSAYPTENNFVFYFKKNILTVILIFSFLIALKMLGIQPNDFAELILRIPFTKLFLIFSITLITAFCIYGLLKISSEINYQTDKYKLIARKSQEVIGIYLEKIKDYEFCKYYLDNNLFMEKISKELNISKEFYKKQVFPFIRKDNLEYRLISYTDSKGGENNIWRFKYI